jgi:hypothetical protein
MTQNRSLVGSPPLIIERIRSYALRVIIGDESPLFSEQNATADRKFCGVPHNTQSG